MFIIASDMPGVCYTAGRHNLLAGGVLGASMHLEGGL